MTGKKKIVIWCPYPHGKAPSQRFRFEQYLEFLKEDCQVKQLSFWSESSNALLYHKGRELRKAMGLFQGLFRRMKHLFVSMNADVVLVHREATPLGLAFFEFILSKVLRKSLVFDFDDAIWKLDTSEGNKHLEWLKSASKTSKVISYSKAVIAGNRYLADYSKNFNHNTTVIPTTIDMNYHKAGTSDKDAPVVIGWTGSSTTVKHFELAIDILVHLKNKYGEKVHFLLIGDGTYISELVEVESIPWRKETEISDLNRIDIGIMPLPNDEWAKGKCGFKGLQYMSIGLPCVLSPVGVNKEIIEHGVNGFLAESSDDWKRVLEELVESKEKRDKIGAEGQRTVKQEYSVEANWPRYKEVFKEILE